MKQLMGFLGAALGLASAPRRPVQAVTLELTPEQEAERVKQARMDSRPKERTRAERVVIRRYRARLDKPRRLRKAARVARKANRS